MPGRYRTGRAHACQDLSGSVSPRGRVPTRPYTRVRVRAPWAWALGLRALVPRALAPFRRIGTPRAAKPSG